MNNSNSQAGGIEKRKIHNGGGGGVMMGQGLFDNREKKGRREIKKEKGFCPRIKEKIHCLNLFISFN